VKRSAASPGDHIGDAVSLEALVAVVVAAEHDIDIAA
jgi:hypothetical protein